MTQLPEYVEVTFHVGRCFVFIVCPHPSSESVSSQCQWNVNVQIWWQSELSCLWWVQYRFLESDPISYKPRTAAAAAIIHIIWLSSSCMAVFSLWPSGAFYGATLIKNIRVPKRIHSRSVLLCYLAQVNFATRKVINNLLNFRGTNQSFWSSRRRLR